MDHLYYSTSQTFFYTCRAYKNEETEFGPRKPWISLSGDDDGKHYILTPVSESRDSFEYELHLFIESGEKKRDR